MKEQDDNILVARIVEGDMSSFRILVERYATRLFYLGMKFFHNREDAEDFSQNVLLTVFDRISTFRGNVPFNAWLYRVAFNTAVNRYHFNTRRLKEMEEVSVNEDNLAGTLNHPEENYLEKELKGSLDSVLKELPDAYNIVIQLHYYEGLTYHQISGITDIPENTIKSHIFRAKRIIRHKMMENGYYLESKDGKQESNQG